MDELNQVSPTTAIRNLPEKERKRKHRPDQDLEQKEDQQPASDPEDQQTVPANPKAVYNPNDQTDDDGTTDSDDSFIIDDFV